MKTRNAMQLKSFIKTRAIELNLRPQQMLHTYYMECFVNRLAHSDYVDNFILKGGYLISNLIGFQARTTMDVDTTVKNFPIDESAMTAALTHVCQVPVEDDFTFELDHLERIREEDDYQGLRAFLNVSYGEIRGTLTMDITAGDSIYPAIQQMFFKRNFDNSLIKAWSYPVENILAEKLETIITRDEFNTRPRDYYDVYMLTKLVEFDVPTLKHALLATAEHRKSTDVVTKEYAQRLNIVEQSNNVRRLWNRYSSNFNYTKGISFEAVFEATHNLLEKVMKS